MTSNGRYGVFHSRWAALFYDMAYQLNEISFVGLLSITNPVVASRWMWKTTVVDVQFYPNVVLYNFGQICHSFSALQDVKSKLLGTT